MSVVRRAVRDRIAVMALPAVRRAVRVQDRLDPETGAVALTFDDGPDPDFTPLVLDALADHGVHATFFVAGEQAVAHPHLVRRLSTRVTPSAPTRGRILIPRASGTATWPRSTGAGREAVEVVVGASVTLFRPPNGHLDPVGAAAIRVNRLRPWLWTVDPRDWAAAGVRPEDIAAVSAATLAAGDVVLLHDGLCQPTAPRAQDRSATVEAVALIIERGRRLGLGFVPLPVDRAAGQSPEYGISSPYY